MPLCGKIFRGSGYDCDNPIQPGVDDRLILFNYNDLDVVTFDSEGRITNITLVAGASAHVFEQFRTSLTAQYAFIPQTVSVGYDHQLTFNCFDISHDSKKNLERMALGKMVAIVENVNAVGNEDTIFEVYGIGAGMEVQTMTRIANDLETAGSFAVDMKTSDNRGKENAMPTSYWDTDYATTKAKIDQIVSGANIVLNSGTVENAAPTDIVLTFDKVVTNVSGVTIGGSTVKGVSSITGIGTAVITVTADAAFVNGDTIEVDGVFEAVDGVIALNDQPITNNVA